ncbi:hypothetical protein ACLOJK_028829 [Asimina triloba]
MTGLSMPMDVGSKAGLSPCIPCQIERNSYLRRRLFGNSSSLIVTQPKGGHASSTMVYKLEEVPWFFNRNRIAQSELPFLSIILSAPESHETPQDYHPGHICLHESMLMAKVQIPFEFEVAEVLLTFHVSPVRFTPHSWKGYAVFTGKGNVKAIDNSPDLTPGWKDVWGILKRWVVPLPEPIFELVAGLIVSQQLALIYFRRIVFCWFPSKEEFLHWARSLEEEDNSVELNSSSGGVFELPPLEGTSLVADLGEEKGASSPRDQVAHPRLREAELSEVARFREELEVSRAKVVRLQASLQEGDVQSLVVIEYLRREISTTIERSSSVPAILGVGGASGEVFAPLCSVDPLVVTWHE